MQPDSGAASRDLVHKLKNLSIVSNGTVVLRNPLEKQNSFHDIASPHLTPLSDSDSPPPSEQFSPEDQSTRKTSVVSGVSVVTKEVYKGRSSRRYLPWTRSSPDGFALRTIEESGLDQVQPTITTVEKAAAAKVFLETYFNEVLYKPNSRNMRRQYLETQLFYSPQLSEDQKNAIRESFCSQETWHMRETRVLKAKSEAAGRGGGGAGPCSENFECLKILGKGSFGVVKLVRDKSPVNNSYPRQVFAMKIIRKSDMLRSSQEGHLRAERDFLVASEGSSWYVKFKI